MSRVSAPHLVDPAGPVGHNRGRAPTPSRSRRVSDPFDDRVAAVRAFNRFYINRVGGLSDKQLSTPYTLTESRVLVELGREERTAVVELRRRLDIDAGYLSRLLGRFESDGLLTRERAETDARVQLIRLTEAGREAYRQVDRASADEVAGLLRPLDEAEQREVVAAMETILGYLRPGAESPRATVRPAGPDDAAWIVDKASALVARQHLDAELGGERIDAHLSRPAHPTGSWVAELRGKRVGCVVCAGLDELRAELVVWLVEPADQGRGIGTRLAAEAIRFARDTGFEWLQLRTGEVDEPTRELVSSLGFLAGPRTPWNDDGTRRIDQLWFLEL